MSRFHHQRQSRLFAPGISYSTFLDSSSLLPLYIQCSYPDNKKSILAPYHSIILKTCTTKLLRPPTTVLTSRHLPDLQYVSKMEMRANKKSMLTTRQPQSRASTPQDHVAVRCQHRWKLRGSWHQHHLPQRHCNLLLVYHHACGEA